MGLSGEYDQSGLAKRVALAFDDPQLDDIDTLRRSNRQCCGVEQSSQPGNFEYKFLWHEG